MATILGNYVLSALAGGSIMYIGSKIDDYESKNVKRTYFGPLVFVIGYGISWNGPVSHLRSLKVLLK